MLTLLNFGSYSNSYNFPNKITSDVCMDNGGREDKMCKKKKFQIQFDMSTHNVCMCCEQ